MVLRKKLLWQVGCIILCHRKSRKWGVALGNTILFILSLNYAVNIGWMSVFCSNGRKLSTIIANHPQNLHFPAKTQMQMCWHSKFPWLGLMPPYMTHLVPARRANLLLAGSSFQISIELHRRPSRRDSLEVALFPLFQGFCLPSLTLPWDKWIESTLFQQTFYFYS